MKILVITETDACCGPMAAVFLNDYSKTVEAVSVGRHPAQSVHALAVEVMHECLADLSGYRPQAMDSVDTTGFDTVYECPDLPVPDSMEEARRVRDYVKNEAYLFFCGLLRSSQ